MINLLSSHLEDCSTPQYFCFAIRCEVCGEFWYSSSIPFSKSAQAADYLEKKELYEAIYQREKERAKLAAGKEAKMNQNTRKKRAFQMPHVFIILLLIMLFIVILSYAIPSGSYERIVDSATGLSVIDPETFHYVENDTPITFMNYFEAVYNGFVNGATIMGTLFICSGVIYLLEASGAFGAFIGVILDRTKGKEFSVVCIFYTIFVIFGVYRLVCSSQFFSRCENLGAGFGLARHVYPLGDYQLHCLTGA